MNNKYSAYWLFYTLGLAFWLLNRNAAESTLICVFYSIFVGTVWGLVPKVSGEEPLSWKFLLPPFLLVVLMMFSVTLKMVMSTEVVLITAISLIHLRSSILSFARLSNIARTFPLIQIGLFFYGLLYLFQKNILPFFISRTQFFISMMAISTVSIGILLSVKRKTPEAISQ